MLVVIERNKRKSERGPDLSSVGVIKGKVKFEILMRSHTLRSSKTPHLGPLGANSVEMRGSALQRKRRRGAEGSQFPIGGMAEWRLGENNLGNRIKLTYFRVRERLGAWPQQPPAQMLVGGSSAAGT